MNTESLRKEAIEHHTRYVESNPFSCRILHEVKTDAGTVGVDITSVYGNKSGKYTVRFYLAGKAISKAKLDAVLLQQG